MKKRILLHSLVGSLLMLSSCGGGSGNETAVVDPDPIEPIPRGKIDPNQARLEPGLSCTEFRAYLIESFTEKYLSSSTNCIDCEITAVSAESDLLASPFVVSDTNQQEFGVSESDNIKVDSEGNLFVADYKRLHIIDGFAPQEMSVRATIHFEEYIRDVILDEARARLIVLSDSGFVTTFSPFLLGADASNFIASEVVTTVRFFDIQDLSNPIEINQFHHSGYLHTERYIDGELFLLTWDFVNDPIEDYETFWELRGRYQTALRLKDFELADQLALQIESSVKERIDNESIDALLPAIYEQNPDGTFSSSTALNCEDIYAPNVSVNPNIVSIYKLDFDGELIDAIASITTINDAYVNANNIFLYQGSAHWWWSPNAESETAIHQFSIDSTIMQYKGVGMIPGAINNRFSLSEHDGFLRVASHEASFEDGAVVRTNHMHVLGQGINGVLPVVGKTQSYADDETIFSARFMGDRGFVVTFRQIDPLFTFDLSDPQSPRLVGELEIPGFSEYIHPIAEDRLLTVGANGDADGLLPGVRLQLFDVSVLDDPVLLHSYVPLSADGDLAYSWSTSSYDHRAFNYFNVDSLLTIPLIINGASNFESRFSGFVSMKVSDADGFTELGRIDHDSFLYPVICVQSPCPSDYYNSDSFPRRSVVIKDDAQTFLYSLSTNGVVATSIDDYSTALGLINFSEIFSPTEE